MHTVHKSLGLVVTHETSQARQDVLAMFQALSEHEQQAIIGSKASGRTVAQPKEKGELIIREYVPPMVDATGREEKSQTLSTPMVTDDENVRDIHFVAPSFADAVYQEETHPTTDGETSPPKRGRPKKAVDPEKAAKV